MPSSASAAVLRIFSGAPGGGWDSGMADSLELTLMSLHCPLQGLRGAPTPEPHAVRAQDGAPFPGHQARRGEGHQPTALQERVHTGHQWLHRRCQWAHAGTDTRAVHRLNQVPRPSYPNASNHCTSDLAKDNKGSPTKQASLVCFFQECHYLVLADQEFAM